MSTARREALLIFDFGMTPPADGDYSPWWNDEAFKTERDVARSLRRLGYNVKLLGLHDDVRPLIDAVRTVQPAFVFNLCEAYRARREHEPNITALLDLLGVPYTGAPTQALHLCKDKGTTKKILAWHGVRVPRFEVVARGKGAPALRGFPFPAIVKPLNAEGSEGISQKSVVRDAAACRLQVKAIQKRFRGDVIIEEYIEGREIYTGVIGNDRLTVLPPREFVFGRVAAGTARVATFRSKWDDGYRKRWGLRTDKARGIGAETERRIGEAARQIYQTFQIKGYARMDFRVTPDGEPVFLESNPNPAIGDGEDFAKAARAAGMEYDELIGRIVNLARSA